MQNMSAMVSTSFNNSGFKKSYEKRKDCVYIAMISSERNPRECIFNSKGKYSQMYRA